jgi:hypothetical protein
MSVRDFFAAIVGREPATSYIEIRHKQPNGVYYDYGQKFFPVADVDRAADFALRVGAELDTFTGMAPRVRKRGKNDDVERAWVLSADCDTDAAIDALESFRPRPSIVVRSGGLTDRRRPKLHAHWRLHEPVDRAGFVAAKVRLASALSSDSRIVDAARIMRVPGTWNFKDSARAQARSQHPSLLAWLVASVAD